MRSPLVQAIIAGAGHAGYRSESQGATAIFLCAEFSRRPLGILTFLPSTLTDVLVSFRFQGASFDFSGLL
jgi:hypothetical protein